jgi:hypothetical protein
VPDYEIHLGSKDLNSLLGDESDLTSDSGGLYEDPDEIEKLIEEELGTGRSRRRQKFHHR